MKKKIKKWMKAGSALIMCGALVCSHITCLAENTSTEPVVIDISGSDYGTNTSEITAKTTNLSLNTVKTSIFGGNISWIDEGYGLWNTEDDEPYAIMTEKLKNSGVQHLRYPGGIEGDYFHWYETIGDLSERVNQINCFSREYPTYDAYNGVEYPVEFGVDELFEVCKAAGIGATIQLNAGTGTTDEAADYVQYLMDKGYIDSVDSICIGNEVCMDNENVEGITISKNPVDYTKFCEEVLKKVGTDVVEDESIELGVIGITPSHPLCAYKNWDAIVLDSLASQIDFIDVHIGYSYYSQGDATAEESVKCFLASAKWIEGMIAEEESIIEEYAGEYADDISIQITECGPVGGDYPNTLAGSLFLADFYNTVLKNSRITATDYLPVLNHYASAQLIGASTYSGASASEVYWDNCVSHVFRWYSDQIGRDVLETTVEGCDTFDSVEVGLVPAISDVEEGTVQVYYDENSGEGSIFVLNKSMDENLQYNITLPTTEAKITGVTELWNKSPIAQNTHTNPETVTPVTYDTYNNAFSGEINLTTKPVSLVKIDFTSEEDIKVTYDAEGIVNVKDEVVSENTSNNETTTEDVSDENAVIKVVVVVAVIAVIAAVAVLAYKTKKKKE